MLVLFAITLPAAHSAPLVDDLGGPEGFGDPVFTIPPSALDLGDAPGGGIRFYDQLHQQVFINLLGTLSLGEADCCGAVVWSLPTPPLDGVLFPPRIAAYQSSNAIPAFPLDGPPVFMYAGIRILDDGRTQHIATWHDVPDRGPNAVGQPLLNSWQAIITPTGDTDTADPGDFDLEFRYARCEYVHNGGQPQGVRPIIGFDEGIGLEGRSWTWPGSDSDDAGLACELSNVREPGVFRFQFRGGVPSGCGIPGPPPEGAECNDGHHLPGQGCSPGCLIEPDVDDDRRTEAPRPDSVDPLDVYDDCVDPDEPDCDDDPDEDGIPTLRDNCPNTSNPDQLNYDQDNEGGDACDVDADNDALLFPLDLETRPNDFPDNCPLIYNRGTRIVLPDLPRIAQQLDIDGDGLGDACDPDDDGDGVEDCGGDGICAENDNGYDDDRDLITDESSECAPDDERFDRCWGDRDLFDNDNDGFVDDRDERDLPRVAWPGPDLPPARPEDNCRRVPNPQQIDRDGDFIGDACDPDPDGDGVSSCLDGEICGPQRDGRDNDLDGVIDEVAECQSGCDPGSDLVDQDRDGYVDEVLEAEGALPHPLPLDNCPFLHNPAQVDSNGDGVGDLCADDDGDGIRGVDDNCPGAANADQFDLDEDGLGDVCDDDDDDDGTLDVSDVCPRLPDDQSDLDGDMIGDACDPDDDADGVNDPFDLCPRHYDPEQPDLDGDGEGDACDDDDDGDGTPDDDDVCPRLADDQADLDRDSIGDACDDDDDGDGVADEADLCPTTPDDQSDLDEDGLGDACDDSDDRPFDRLTPEEQCAVLLADRSSTAHRLGICPAATGGCAAAPAAPAPDQWWMLAGLLLLRRRRRR